MEENKFDIKFSEKVQKDTTETSEFVKKARTEFNTAKTKRDKRAGQVKRNVSSMRKIVRDVDESSNRFSGKISKTVNADFVSPVLVAIVEYLASSDFIPDINFERQKFYKGGGDVFLARNSTNVHDSILEEGEFYKEVKKGSPDLFIKGRLYISKGYRLSEDGYPELIKYKYMKWEKVYKNGDIIFIMEELTAAELVDEFGEDIKNAPIKVGNPFNEKEDSKLAFSSENKGETKIGVVRYWNPLQKQYGVFIGSSTYIQEMAVGKTYPIAWTDGRGRAFAPVDWIDGSLYKPDGENPLATVDRIVTCWETHSILMNSTIKRAKKAANPQEIIGSSLDPGEARKAWMQDEINRANGVDIPHFIKDDGISGKLFAATLDIGSNNANVFAWRDVLFDEIMISEGVNIRALGQGAPTAEQERLRSARELETIQRIIENNLANWERFAMNNMYMLQGVESKFLDSSVDVEDEISEELGGETDEGSVREIIDAIEAKDYRFKVSVSINNSNQKRKQIELAQKREAMTTIGNAIGASPALSKMAFDIAKQEYPNLPFTSEDFIPTQPEPEAEAMNMPTAQQTNPLALENV